MLWYTLFINKDARTNDIFLAQSLCDCHLLSKSVVAHWTGTRHASTSPPCGGNGTVGRLANSVPERR